MNAVLIDEQLEAAYRAVANRSWPDLHELKLAAARYKLVEGYAMRRATGAFTTAPAPVRASDQAAYTRPPNVNAPAPAQRPPVPPGPRSAAIFDHKRAAAGERDDD